MFSSTAIDIISDSSTLVKLTENKKSTVRWITF